MRLLPPLLAACVLLAGCSPAEGPDAGPDAGTGDVGAALPLKPLIQPDRLQVDFGGDFGNAVYVGTQPQEVVQLKNVGQELLTLSNVSLTGPEAGLFTAGVNTASIESLRKAFLTVTYQPTAAGKHSAKVVITSNSSENATLEIPVTATAVEH